MLYILRPPPIAVIVADVEYADGVVVLRSPRGEELAFPFTPSILLPPPIFSILDVDIPFILHPHAVEVFGELDDLFKLYRKASRLSSAVLLIPPARQFLLKKGITYGHDIGQHVPVGLPLAERPEDAMRAILRERYFSNPAITYLENIAYVSKVPVSFLRRGSAIDAGISDVFTVLSQLRVAPDADYSKGDVLLPASPGSYAGAPLSYGEALLFDLADQWMPSERYYRPTGDSPFLRGLLWVLRAASRYYSLLPRQLSTSVAPPVVSAHNYLLALHQLADGLRRLLLSTDVLGDVGRRSLILALRLRHRKPKLYRSLYANVPICSHGLKGLEYFLHVRFSSPTARPL